MKRKLGYGLVLILFLTGLLISKTTVGAQPIMTTFKVEPEHSAGAVGAVITLSVNVYDAEDLWGWQVLMSWDPLVLGFVDLTFGDFLADQPDGTAQLANLEYVNDGWFLCSETTFGAYPGVTAPSGWLMDVAFEVLSQGEATIYIDSPFTFWQDSELNVYGDEPDEMIKENGSFSNVAPSISVYTDKLSYLVGDTMHLGLDINNPLDHAITVCVAIWLERPIGPRVVILHAHAVTLPTSLTYSNPDFETFTLPSIPGGVYTWHAALLNPATHAILVEDTAQWTLA